MMRGRRNYFTKTGEFFVVSGSFTRESEVLAQDLVERLLAGSRGPYILRQEFYNECSSLSRTKSSVLLRNK